MPQTLLWPASGAGWPLKGLGVASPDHQVGALFEALDEGVLMVPSKSIGYFFAISSCPEVRCATYQTIQQLGHSEKNLSQIQKTPRCDQSNRNKICKLTGMQVFSRGGENQYLAFWGYELLDQQYPCLHSPANIWGNQGAFENNNRQGK